jgi:hypothetical protein
MQDLDGVVTARLRNRHGHNLIENAPTLPAPNPM